MGSTWDAQSQTAHTHPLGQISVMTTGSGGGGHQPARNVKDYVKPISSILSGESLTQFVHTGRS